MAHGNGEGHIHVGAVGWGDGVDIEAVRIVNGIIQDLGLGVVGLLHRLNASIAQHVVEDQAAHVDSPAGRSVVHRPLHHLKV